MKGNTVPHFHLSGANAVVLFLYIVAVFGGLHMVAASFPESQFSRAWLKLGF